MHHSLHLLILYNVCLLSTQIVNLDFQMLKLWLYVVDLFFLGRVLDNKIFSLVDYDFTIAHYRIFLLPQSFQFLRVQSHFGSMQSNFQSLPLFFYLLDLPVLFDFSPELSQSLLDSSQYLLHLLLFDLAFLQHLPHSRHFLIECIGARHVFQQLKETFLPLEDQSLHLALLHYGKQILIMRREKDRGKGYRSGTVLSSGMSSRHSRTSCIALSLRCGCRSSGKCLDQYPHCKSSWFWSHSQPLVSSAVR